MAEFTLQELQSEKLRRTELRDLQAEKARRSELRDLQTEKARRSLVSEQVSQFEGLQPSPRKINPRTGLMAFPQTEFTPESVSLSLDEAGFDKTPLSGISTVGEGIVEGGLNLGKGILRAPPELVAAAIDDPIEFAKGLVKFIPEQADLIFTAIGQPSSTGKGTKLTRKINKRTGLLEDQKFEQTPEQVTQARESLFQSPEGPLFAALFGRSIGKSVAKRAKPKTPTESAIEPNAFIAKKRVEARFGNVEVSGDLGDFVVLGADKVAKGTTDFKQWSSQMRAEYGDAVRSNLAEIYNESIRFKETIAKPLLTKDKSRPKVSVIKEIKKTFTEYVDRTPATFKSSGKIDLKSRETVKAEPTIDGTPISTFTDIGNIPANFNTFPRIMRKVLGKERADRMFVDMLDNAKGNTAEMALTLLEDMESTITTSTGKGGFGIGEGSKLSKAVQEFGEQTRTYESLVKQFGENSANNVVKATKWFRGQYDLLIDEVNATMRSVYPNNPTKLIAKRTDYFRHFRDLSEGVTALKEIVTTPADISPSLSGISQFTRPLMKFLSIAQRRKGTKTKIDAVGGFKNYILQASYAKHITPQIRNLRNFATELRQASEISVQAGGKPNLNRYIEYIDDFANQLSGKTGPADRVFIKIVPGGRKALNMLNWTNQRVAQNAILGNIRSLFAMPANIANAAGVLKLDLARGSKATIVGIFDKNSPIRKSAFWRERNLHESFNRFNTEWMRHPVRNTGRFAGWLIATSDKLAGHPIWHGAYRQALERSIANPSRYADNIARDLLGGRGIGDKPLAFTEKTLKPILTFQLEVTNAWYVLRGLVSERDFAGLATAMVAAWTYNQMLEQTTGGKVLFDPIDAMIDATDTFTDQNEGDLGERSLKAAGRLVGEALSAIPTGQLVGALYPQNGIGDLPSRKELFGAEDPTRFGTGVLVVKAISDPIYSLLPPFGGQQIKKTVGGIQSQQSGEVRSRSGKTSLFPVPDDPETIIKGVLFGKWATDAAKEYFERKRKSRVKGRGTRRRGQRRGGAR